MIEFLKKEKSIEGDASLPYVKLSSEKRKIVRQKIKLSDGKDAGIFLDRGTLLEPFDVLISSEGIKALVIAEDEDVICAKTDSWDTFSKACYHLGNRHVPLQINDRELCFLPDKVLEELCCRLGLKVSHEKRPFIPEHGAYAHHHHEHGETNANHAH